MQSFVIPRGTEHSKCPNCNNKDLPQKDMEWELPSSAGFYNFADHYVMARRCAVATCRCEEGRGYSDVEGAGTEQTLVGRGGAELGGITRPASWALTSCDLSRRNGWGGGI